MTNPLYDDSRWTIVGPRFDIPKFLYEEYEKMFNEWIDSLPADSPALKLHELLSGMTPEEFLGMEDG